MKIRSLSIAAALTCLASSSFALTPAQIDGTTVQLWLSGATAPTAAVYGAIRKMCAQTAGNPTDLHVYLEKPQGGTDVTLAADAAPGKSKAGKFAAYACTMGPSSVVGTALAGKKAVIYHTFDAGSFEAYTPHLSLAGEVNDNVSSTVKRLKDIKASGSTCVLNTLGTSTPTYLGCGSTTVTVAPNASVFVVPTVPVGGVSDTEFTLNKLNLSIIKDLADIGTEVSSNVAQGFGLAVSYPLYIGMQESQGLKTDSSCLDVAGVPNLTNACQPNISRQKYSSLVGGNAADKDAGLLASTLAGAQLTVERRVGTSGTQSASNAFFLNAPCATGLAGGSIGADGSNVLGVDTVYDFVTIRSNNGSGDVKARLTSASTGGTHAIGVLSLENSPSSTEKFAFTKLNGVSPTADANQRQAAIDGDYEFWYELVAFTAASASTQGKGLMSSMVKVMANPNVTNLKGLFVTPLNAGGFTNATFQSQVSKGAKTGNACAVSTQ